MGNSKTRSLQTIASVGYAARGLVFLIVGAFVGVAAIESYGRPPDSKDALRTFLFEPFGSVLLLALAAGLLCFAVWRTTQALTDVDSRSYSAKGSARRFVHGVAGLFYLCFASVIASMVFGMDRSGSGDQVIRDWTGWLLQKPLGPWIVGVSGLVIIGTGLGIGIAGLRAEFGSRIDLRRQPRLLVIALGVTGYLTRAIVFVLIGSFLLFAAVNLNARQARGMAGALAAIQAQPYGSALLGATALGFMAFGVFGFAEAMFRRLPGRTGTIWSRQNGTRGRVGVAARE